MFLSVVSHSPLILIVILVVLLLIPVLVLLASHSTLLGFKWLIEVYNMAGGVGAVFSNTRTSFSRSSRKK